MLMHADKLSAAISGKVYFICFLRCRAKGNALRSLWVICAHSFDGRS